MSQGMEEVQEALTINQVPGRNFLHTASWEAIAWPSKRPLKVIHLYYFFFIFFFLITLYLLNFKMCLLTFY